MTRCQAPETYQASLCLCHSTCLQTLGNFPSVYKRVAVSALFALYSRHGTTTRRVTPGKKRPAEHSIVSLFKSFLASRLPDDLVLEQGVRGPLFSVEKCVKASPEVLAAASKRIGSHHLCTSPASWLKDINYVPGVFVNARGGRLQGRVIIFAKQQKIRVSGP